MTTNRFDHNAADWDKKKRRVLLATAIAERIGQFPLHDKMAAMEYGCGTGLVGLALAPRLGSLTAVDSSEGMLQVLADKAKELRLTNVTPLQLDLTSRSYDGKFDLIFTAMTLHHIKEVDTLLHRFFDLLTENGLLLIADLEEEDGSFHSSGIEDVKHHGFDPQLLTQRLAAIGFNDIGWKTIYNIEKVDKDGNPRQYPIFLLSGTKKTG